jgi:hypothetical protein
MSNCWSTIFSVLPKINECQVDFDKSQRLRLISFMKDYSRDVIYIERVQESPKGLTSLEAAPQGASLA